MRSRKKIPFSDSRVNSKFKTINWPEYNNSLRNRGRIDFMIAENLSIGWYEIIQAKESEVGKEDIVIRLFSCVYKFVVCLGCHFVRHKVLSIGSL
jgi:hypothetical protein